MVSKKTQNLPHFPNCLRCSLFQNSNRFHRVIIHSITILVDNPPQILHFSSKHITLCRIQLQSLSSQSLQCASHMLQMLFEGLTVHNHVIQVRQRILVSDVTKCLLHVPLENSWGILQSHGYSHPFKQTPRCDEGSFLSTIFAQETLVIRSRLVHN